MSKRFALILPIIVGLALAAAGLSAHLSEPTALTVAAVATSDGAPLPLPSLAAIVGDAADDSTALARIVDFYERNHDALAVVFNESNDTRLRALFGMYITHLAAPYNVVEAVPITLLDFVHTPTAHCGTYSLAQGQIYDALGISWRTITVDRGWHGLIEVLVGRQYETFDSTANVWINLSIGEMIAGMTHTVTDEPRIYREFYAPVLDPAMDERYRAHMTSADCPRCSTPELRAGVSQWGLRVFPSVWTVSAQG